MTRLTIAPLAALALAACNQSSVSLTNASPAEVAKAEASADIQIRPGQWETVARVTDIQMPGLPPEMRGMMTAKMNEAVTISNCVTAEDVGKFDPGGGLDKASQGCTYSNYTRTGGRLASTLTCTTSTGANTTITSRGTYSADSYTGESEIDTTGGPGGSVHVKSTVTARRTGDCTAAR